MRYFSKGEGYRLQVERLDPRRAGGRREKKHTWCFLGRRGAGGKSMVWTSFVGGGGGEGGKKHTWYFLKRGANRRQVAVLDQLGRGEVCGNGGKKTYLLFF